MADFTLEWRVALVYCHMPGQGTGPGEGFITDLAPMVLPASVDWKVSTEQVLTLELSAAEYALENLNFVTTVS